MCRPQRWQQQEVTVQHVELKCCYGISYIRTGGYVLLKEEQRTALKSFLDGKCIFFLSQMALAMSNGLLIWLVEIKTDGSSSHLPSIFWECLPFFKHFPRTPPQMVPCNKASGESGYETLSLFKWYPELSWTWGKEFWQQPKLISKHRSHSRNFLASATRANPKVGSHHGKKRWSSTCR